MPRRNRDTRYNRARGWRQRRRWRFRRIEPSPHFAQFLTGELDSSEYARLLMRPRKTAGLKVQPKPLGPIAKAYADSVAGNARTHPVVTSRTAQVSLEYIRFLREEISSSDYAEALTGYAKLEGLYRAPAARFSFPRRGIAEALIDALRFVFALAGLAITILGLFLVLGPLGVKLAASALQWAWSISLVGAALLVLTVRNEASSVLFGVAHSIQRFVGERLAHERT
jgi:hypothetical protein